MPIEYVRDDERRLLRLRGVEPITLADVLTTMHRQIAEGAWAYGTLVDLRTAILPAAEREALLNASRELAQQHGRQGPVAMVTRQTVGNAQAFAIRSGQVSQRVQVFWDIGEAERWLRAQLGD